MSYSHRVECERLQHALRAAVARVEAAESKLAGLAAENLALKGYIDDECYIANPTGMDYIGAYSSSVETSATDAYLNSVRAEGAMACGIHLREWYDYQVEVRAEEFAAQLRAGEPS